MGKNADLGPESFAVEDQVNDNRTQMNCDTNPNDILLTNTARNTVSKFAQRQWWTQIMYIATYSKPKSAHETNSNNSPTYLH